MFFVLTVYANRVNNEANNVLNFFNLQRLSCRTFLKN